MAFSSLRIILRSSAITINTYVELRGWYCLDKHNIDNSDLSSDLKESNLQCEEVLRIT